MMNSKEFTNAFAELGNPVLDETKEAHIEAFVCVLYGHRKTQSVNAARFASFMQYYAPKDEPLDKIRGINPSSMPPCQNVLKNKVKRANFVTSMWKRSHLKDPIGQMKPERWGWIVEDGKYEIAWFEGDQVPHEIGDILMGITSVQQEEEDEEVTYGERLYRPDLDDEGSDN
jgi:hypothetical protein